MSAILPVYLSPHFDDVALSVGGLAASGPRGLCITGFAAPPPPDEALTPYALRLHTRWGEPDPAAGNALRRAEEHAAMRILGLDLVLLPYGDAIYRAGRYLSNPDIFGAVHPAEAGLPAELAAAIAEIIRAWAHGRAPLIYAPLGLGHHVDHQLTFAAARLLDRGGWDVRYYEDFPYAAKPGAHTARFAELESAAVGSVTASTCLDIAPVLETKIAAVASYASQISSLFPSLEAMPAAVRDYAARVGAECAAAPPFAERYWRLPVGLVPAIAPPASP